MNKAFRTKRRITSMKVIQVGIDNYRIYYLGRVFNFIRISQWGGVNEVVGIIKRDINYFYSTGKHSRALLGGMWT